MRYADAEAVKPMLKDGCEIAFLDVREHGQYGEGHPFFAVSLPYSRLELLAPRLLPCRTVRCVLLDGGDGVAEMALKRLSALGFDNLTIMRDGAPGWAAAGYTLFKGVNLPSKTFGELVEHAMDTPSIAAGELKAALDAGDDLILLDGRTPDEFLRTALSREQSAPLRKRHDSKHDRNNPNPCLSRSDKSRDCSIFAPVCSAICPIHRKPVLINTFPNQKNSCSLRFSNDQLHSIITDALEK
jgi:rhodanese-related sulfurtransferase